MRVCETAFPSCLSAIKNSTVDGQNTWLTVDVTGKLTRVDGQWLRNWDEKRGATANMKVIHGTCICKRAWLMVIQYCALASVVELKRRGEVHVGTAVSAVPVYRHGWHTHTHGHSAYLVHFTALCILSVPVLFPSLSRVCCLLCQTHSLGTWNLDPSELTPSVRSGASIPIKVMKQISPPIIPSPFSCPPPSFLPLYDS